MRWIAALLLIMNVALFLWISGQHSLDNTEPATASPDINKSAMLLLSEVPSNIRSENLVNHSVSDEAAVIEPESEPVEEEVNEPIASEENVVINALEPAEVSVDVSADVSIESEDSPNTTASAVDLPICYRVGPFRNKDLYESAMQWVSNQGLDFQSIETRSRELRAVRVFMGPFESLDASLPVSKRLDSLDLDYFAYVRDDGLARISLGYFTQEQLAEKFVDHLSSLGVGALTEAEYRTLGPYDWIEVNVSDVALSTSLAQRQWEERGVSTARVDCPNA